MLQVTTPPVATDLTTFDAAVAEIGQAPDPIRLAALIAQASAACEGFCGRSFARAGFLETLFCAAYPILLSVTPVWSIDSMTEGGGPTLGTDGYMFDPTAGVVYRDACLNGARIAVAYTAGYVLPGQPGRNLPADVERACLEIVKSYWFAGGSGARDPRIRSDSVEGIGSTSYLDPVAANGGLPDMAAALLRPYQRLGL